MGAIKREFYVTIERDEDGYYVGEALKPARTANVFIQPSRRFKTFGRVFFSTLSGSSFVSRGER